MGIAHQETLCLKGLNEMVEECADHPECPGATSTTEHPTRVPTKQPVTLTSHRHPSRAPTVEHGHPTHAPVALQTAAPTPRPTTTAPTTASTTASTVTTC